MMRSLKVTAAICVGAIIVALIFVLVKPNTKSLQQQRDAIAQKLPTGCALHDAGVYNGIRILYITCANKSTSNNIQYWEQSTGKVIISDQALVTIIQ